MQFINRTIHTSWVYLFAVILGLMQAFAFDLAPESLFSIIGIISSLISLAGFLYVTSIVSSRRALLFGALFGLACFGWGLNWIYISMANFGNAPLVFAIGANAVAVAILASYWLASAYIITKLGKTRKQRLLIAPAVIVLLEWVRSFFLIGFPWLSIGYGYIDSKIAFFAAYVGVFGVSFIALSFVSFALLKTRGAIIGLTSIVLLSLFMPSDEGNKSAQSIKIALIQGNMPVITAYDNERMAKNLVKYRLLTEELLKTEKPDVVIWPESAIPYFYAEAKPFLEYIQKLQTKHHFDLITGVSRVELKNRTIYNSVLLQSESKKSQLYDKVHLLPFGEYLPFRDFLLFFENFVEIPMADFSKGGKSQKPFSIDGLTFAISICYEAVFGDEVRQTTRGAQIMLNVSNDAWFGQSKAQIQHLNITRMRAVENGKTLVRVTNDGRTAIIAKTGGILQSIPAFADGTLVSTVYASDEQTLYSQFGDKLIVLLCAFIVISVAVFGRFTRVKTVPIT